MYGGHTESVNRTEIEKIVRRVLEETVAGLSAPGNGGGEEAGGMTKDMGKRLTAATGGLGGIQLRQ